MTKIIDLNPELHHPYMDILKSTLETQKKLLELLQKRRSYLQEYAKSHFPEPPQGHPYENFDERYKHNEYLILLIETDGRIAAQNKSVADKEQYFIKYMQQFTVDADECEKEFDKVIKRAQQINTPEMKLSIVNWEMVEKNIEVRIALFKRLKELIK